MPTKAKLTLDQFHRMVDAGILDNCKVEFIEGELIEMPPENPIHSGKGNKLAFKLYDLLKDVAIIRFNSPITLSNSEPEPDIVVARKSENEYEDHHPYPEDIYLVIEVSNSTLKYDLEEKARIYARAGILEYWVVDVVGKNVTIFLNPQNDSYAYSEQLSGGGISPHAFPDAVIDLSKFLY